ncbi:SRPBCC family protein [Virgibacillus sp. YIM 98842]|uniref:CoxG family protein n=1 Tax=Virgibacillus sp. YIM 98842 TaxID=2663533 RepID=UPI0013DA8273|nr:SRPBCC family protein [Virgibacillus sp. YIM 98842]
MPSAHHQMELEIPIHRAWNFVKDMNNWAPLVPGYSGHKQLNDRQSTWTFTGEAGFVQKTVQLRLDIKEWAEPTRVMFTLKGMDENISGDGYFQADALSEKSIKMTGYLQISAGGFTGPMINPILKTLLPKTMKRFTESVAYNMMKRQTAEAVNI